MVLTLNKVSFYFPNLCIHPTREKMCICTEIHADLQANLSLQFSHLNYDLPLYLSHLNYTFYIPALPVTVWHWW